MTEWIKIEKSYSAVPDRTAPVEGDIVFSEEVCEYSQDNACFVTPDTHSQTILRSTDKGFKLSFIQCNDKQCFLQEGLDFGVTGKVTAVMLKDVNADGLKDLVVGFQSGAMYYFKGVK